MMNSSECISEFAQNNDVFILDRGFRDVIKDLNQKGIRTLMPNLLAKGQKQFTTEEANESRKVTLLRWVVEAVNGRLKKMFKFFDHNIQCHYFMNSCEKLNRLLRISCAIMNRYCPPIYHDTDDQTMLLEDIQKKDTAINPLMKEIMANEKEFVRKRVCWKKYTSAEFQDFPQITLEELRKISLGKFNIKGSRAYTDAVLRADNQYHVHVHRQRPGLLRVRLGSKFRGGSSHLVWIEYSANGEEKILGHYCQCMQGARMITTCGHITSVLWYLGYQRHTKPDYKPRTYGQDIIDVTVKKAQVFTLDDEEVDESDEGCDDSD